MLPNFLPTHPVEPLVLGAGPWLTHQSLKIPIRLAGIDAPEGAHFGRPAQPFSTDALTWLSNYILGKRVHAKVYRRDQYDRIVATVHVRQFLFRRDVSLEMLKMGLATTYEAKSGAEFGGREEKYKAAEAVAKARKLGIWGGNQSASRALVNTRTG